MAGNLQGKIWLCATVEGILLAWFGSQVNVNQVLLTDHLYSMKARSRHCPYPQETRAHLNDLMRMEK